LRGDAEHHGHPLLTERVSVGLGIDGDRYGQLFTQTLLAPVVSA
jgi:hypothetical protein